MQFPYTYYRSMTCLNNQPNPTTASASAAGRAIVGMSIMQVSVQRWQKHQPSADFAA